jgi:hypothetical protein
VGRSSEWNEVEAGGTGEKEVTSTRQRLGNGEKKGVGKYRSDARRIKGGAPARRSGHVSTNDR